MIVPIRFIDDHQVVSAESSRFTLASWRRTVGEMYAGVRAADHDDQAGACHEFRKARDSLFRHHPDSPLSGDRRAGFSRIDYFPYDAK